MTRAHLRANWIGPPSLNQPWLVALLRAFAMLVSFAASIARMRLSLFSGECHTDVEPDALPEPESGITKETEEAVRSSHDLRPPSTTTTILSAVISTTTIFDSPTDDDDDFSAGCWRRRFLHSPWRNLRAS